MTSRKLSRALVLFLALAVCMTLLPLSASAYTAGFDANTLSWSSGDSVQTVGLNGTPFKVGVRFTADDLTEYDGRVMDRVSFYHDASHSLSAFNVEVETRATAGGTAETVVSQSVTQEVPNG